MRLSPHLCGDGQGLRCSSGHRTLSGGVFPRHLRGCGAPYVYILGGGGTGASAAVMLKGSTVLESIGITEGFDIQYGRMYVIMATAPTPLLPTAPSAVALQIPGYHDPPTDYWYPEWPRRGA